MSQVPSIGSIEDIDNRKYKWTKVVNERPEYQLYLEEALRKDRAYLFGDVWLFHDGKHFAKMFRKDITPRHIPDDAIEFPAKQQMMILTQMASEAAVESSALKFQQACGL